MTRRLRAVVEPPHDGVTGRPGICVTGRQLDDLVDDAVQALLATNTPPLLYVRGGAVVTIRRDEERRAMTAELGETETLDRLAAASTWTRLTKDGKPLEAGPTRTLAGLVLSRLHRMEGALPPLRGVTESPLMRADGSILAEPGYDPALRLFYAPPDGFWLPSVPERPQAADLKLARALLDEVLFDFPFVGDADYATAVAALVSLVLREAIDGRVPAFLFDAPAPGTGKGLLADAVTVAATGSPGAKASEPEVRGGDGEWRKRVTALLLEGRAVCVVDNVEQPLGSAALASALTAETWTDRELGRSRMLTLPNRALFIVTGNNLRLRGDLPRRCVWCRLDAREARPWTREGFRHADLVGWVREHRGELLAAVFTIARGWIAAGRPGPEDGTPRLGGFESWRHVVGGVLRVAGLHGFLDNLEDFYAATDEETPAWAAFLAGWRRLYDAGAVTVAELLRQLEAPGSELRELLPGELAESLEKPAAAKRVGRAFLRKVETRYVVDAEGTTLRLVREGESRAKVARWKVATG